jgi:hypothetical protein
VEPPRLPETPPEAGPHYRHTCPRCGLFIPGECVDIIHHLSRTMALNDENFEKRFNDALTGVRRDLENEKEQTQLYFQLWNNLWNDARKSIWGRLFLWLWRNPA